MPGPILCRRGGGQGEPEVGPCSGYVMWGSEPATSQNLTDYFFFFYSWSCHLSVILDFFWNQFITSSRDHWTNDSCQRYSFTELTSVSMIESLKFLAHSSDFLNFVLFLLFVSHFTLKYITLSFEYITFLKIVEMCTKKSIWNDCWCLIDYSFRLNLLLYNWILNEYWSFSWTLSWLNFWLIRMMSLPINWNEWNLDR